MHADDKLRTVLDYTPCEACLATPSAEHELLCSLCRRLDRSVAVKFVTRTSVLVERPEPASTAETVPIVAHAEDPPATDVLPEPEAAPAQAEAPPEEPAVEVVLKRRSFLPLRRNPNAIEVVVEPLEDETPPAPAAAPSPPPEPAQAPEPAPPELAAALEAAHPEPEPFVPRAERADEAPERRRRFPLFGRRERAPEPAPEPAAQTPAEPEEEWDDLVSYEAGPASEAEEDDVFSYTPAQAQPAQAAPEAAPEPAREAGAAYSFDAAEEDAPVEDEAWAPTEEIALEPPAQDAAWAPPEDAWAPPQEDFLDEPGSADESAPWTPPAQPEEDEEALELELVDDDAPEPAPVEEEEVLEMEIVEDEPPAEDEEVLEMEIVEDEPAPLAPAPPAPEAPAPEAPAPAAPAEPAPAAPAPMTSADDGSDLWRLDGLRPEHRGALAEAGIQELTHLSGQDLTPLAERTGIAREQLKAWLHVADFVAQAGVPIDGARAMVRAGIEGPGALAALEPDDVVRQVELAGGGVTAREVKRWKRRV